MKRTKVKRQRPKKEGFDWFWLARLVAGAILILVGIGLVVAACISPGGKLGAALLTLGIGGIILGGAGILTTFGISFGGGD
jgi:hypothetical protein